jgi:hypothetical protein
MAASDHLHPDQFGRIRNPYMNIGLGEISRRLYSQQPEYMSALEDDVKQNGFQHPVETEQTPEGEHHILDGHHRAAVAYNLGIPFPRADKNYRRSPANKDSEARWHRIGRDLEPLAELDRDD